MDLSLTGEQNELLSWADTVLPVEFALDRFNGIEGALKEAALDKLAELGWYGMAVPEPAGGSGMSVLEEMLLMKEAGKHLASPSLLATVVAVHDAVANGDNALAQELMAGSKRASLAVASEDALLAFDADEADLLVAFGLNAVTLQPVGGLARLDGAGTPLDDSLSLMRYGIDQQNAQARAAGAELWMRAHILLAAAQIGLGEAATDMAVEYAKIREQ
ncbi:MAG: acyl-CoA dehydrogenase family protein, partial [Gammaproteobacteria bacterium]|nr:acyl-CoA dehydrogenase family protein [Gammaproteobacteria bacterium]